MSLFCFDRSRRIALEWAAAAASQSRTSLGRRNGAAAARWIGLASGIAALAPLAGQARGSTIDFQVAAAGTTATYIQSGAAATGSAGDVWNYYYFPTGVSGVTGTTPSALSLSNTQQNPTSVTLTLSANGGIAQGSDSETYNSVTPSPLLYQYLVTTGSTFTGTINGLTPNGTYTLYLYGANAYGNGYGAGAKFDITTPSGSTAIVTNYNGAATTAYSMATGSNDNSNYAVFSSITATNSGEIVFTDTTGGGHNDGDVIFNGFQLIGTFPAPEPGTLALASLAGLGLLVRRRRRENVVRPRDHS